MLVNIAMSAGVMLFDQLARLRFGVKMDACLPTEYI